MYNAAGDVLQAKQVTDIISLMLLSTKSDCAIFNTIKSNFLVSIPMSWSNISTGCILNQ